MCVVCALCVSVLLHSRTSALSHLADTALPTPVRSHTGSHWSTHPACRAAPSVLSVWCRTAWCCARHCTVCALLHCCCGQRAVGSVTHCLAAWRLWAVELLLRTAALPGAVGSGTPALHYLSALGQWAGQLLQCSASPSGGVVWCGVVWCGVVWCGAVRCGVVWCGL